MTNKEFKTFVASKANVEEINDDPVVQTLSEAIGVEGAEDILVVTNKGAKYGAGAIANKGIITFVQSCLKAKQFYIIPSSINEVLCIRKDMLPLSEVNQMIQNMNASELEAEERLADYAFEYNGKEIVKAV